MDDETSNQQNEEKRTTTAKSINREVESPSAGLLKGDAMPTCAEELLHTLEDQARDLASWGCPYMADVLLQYYDGDCAEETRGARLKAASKYFDLACSQ